MSNIACKRIDIKGIIMRLRQLQRFVTLAETLNFHRAAEQLNTSQPPLSVSIAKLEAEMGTPLFKRSLRKVELTDAGKAALEEARLTLYHSNQFKAIIQESLQGVAGALKVGFVGSATYSLLPKILPDFRRKFPNVDLKLSESWTTDLIDKIERNEIDAAIIRAPLLDNTSVRIDILEQDNFVAAVRADSKFARLDSIHISDLKDEPIIAFSKERVPNVRGLTMLMFAEGGFSPNIVQEATQAQTLLSLVESGMGIALVAGVTARHSSNALKFLPIMGAEQSKQINLALATQKRHSSRVCEGFRVSVMESVSLDSK